MRQIGQIALAWRFAIRELRGGLRGFYIFIACIALGVAAIAGVNSVSGSITRGIVEQGQEILGGDVSLSMVQREISSEQLAFARQQGTISKNTTLRAMARLEDGSAQALIELKAVDGNYPLFGEFSGKKGVVNFNGFGEDEVLIEGLLSERLGVGVGDRLSIGKGIYTIADIIVREPDRLGENFGFGPRVMISLGGLAKSGLIQPGSLIRHNWKLKLEDGTSSGLEQFTAKVKERFPDAGWRVRTRDKAAPALSRNIERFSDFLTLVGLAALIVGGVGVANAVRAFLETKRPVIATFKCLGAPGNTVFLTYLFQILILSCVGILIGMLVGAMMPLLAIWALQDFLPLPSSGTFQPFSLFLGGVYGLMTAMVFAIWPLGIARDVQATDLFRGQYSGKTARWPRLTYLAMLVLCILLMAGLTLYLAANPLVAAVFIGAVAVAFVALRIVAWLIQFAARKVPHLRSTEWRMAIGNIHRPGSLTPSVVLSLGLGLALLVALALIDSNLRQQISGNIPERAPDFFFVDIQAHEKDAFEDTLTALAPEGKVFSVPMLRGRIIELKGQSAENYQVADGGRWVLRGDRGITYAKNIPENSTLSKGEWWEADYDGPPLVSFAAEEAGELGLVVGDTISVNVLGRNIEARIASLRNVEWESLAINFVMVFSPNTFAGAPHSHLATLTMTENGGQEDGATANPDERDGQIVRSISNDFPAVTSVRVRDALNTVNRLVGQLAAAIRAAASVTLLASILVLAGALAAGNQARIHDAVILKTLGATRARLVMTYIYEYALLGLVTAIFGLMAGGVAAWFVISSIMQLPYAFYPSVGGATLGAALVLTVGFGLIGTWRILKQKAAPVLREL